MKRILNFLKKVPVINRIIDSILEKRRSYLILKKGENLKSYDYLAVYLTKLDKAHAKKDRDLKKLHKDLNKLRKQQVESWNSFVYCKGYFYQGYKRVGIHGIKPTEARMKSYDVYDFFNANGRVLDIGSNSGFLSIYLSDYFKEVVGIELNPYLIRMGECVKNHLGVRNVNFIKADFMSYSFNNQFDAVFSLSNHFTIDGNLNMSFEDYIYKIYNLLNNGGVLFFESHNINGDDSDLDQKFLIASQYFDLKKYKMVKAFYPADIDKLFAVFIKKPSISEKYSSFSLDKARHEYEY